MIISERIFKILQDKNMSQNAFAQKVGLASSTISDWKTKKTNPSADKILKICEVLHVTPYELLSERDMTADEGSDYLAALNNDEGIVLETFRNLQTKQKERLLGYLEALKDIK